MHPCVYALELSLSFFFNSVGQFGDDFVQHCIVGLFFHAYALPFVPFFSPDLLGKQY